MILTLKTSGLRGLGTATAHFNDVPTDHPFYNYIQRVYDAGITSGCSIDPPRFCPDDTVTRGQLAVFLSRMLTNTPAPVDPVPDPGTNAAAGWKIGSLQITPVMAIGGALIIVALLRR